MHYFGVDIGNSGCRVVRLDLRSNCLAPAQRVRWRFDPRSLDLENRPHFSPDDASWLRLIADELSLTPATWLVSSVRRDAGLILERELTERGQDVRFITYRDLPLKVNLDDPAAVGIDRLLAAAAAVNLALSFQGVWNTERILVIQAGSAVTVDQVRLPTAVDDLPCFEGGAIVPGVPMMLRLLGRGADLLPEFEADDLIDLPSLPGQNTKQAMLNGAASALVGGVEHLVQRYRNQLGDSLPVILSGGDGPRLAPHITPPLVTQPDLVQHGLLMLAQRSTSRETRAE